LREAETDYAGWGEEETPEDGCLISCIIMGTSLLPVTFLHTDGAIFFAILGHAMIQPQGCRSLLFQASETLIIAQ
jgi:hypothetical protein